MAGEATPQEINRFVAEVDKFMVNYARLISPQMRSQVYATGNAELIGEYESAVTTGRRLKATIEGTTGAWNEAKRAYQAITDVTSTAIGDAIDWFRGLWGAGPAADLGRYGVEAMRGDIRGRHDVSPISGGTLGYLGNLGAVQLAGTALMAVWLAGIVSAAYLANQVMQKVFIWVDAWLIQRNDPTISTSDAIDLASKSAARGGFFEGAALPLIAAAVLAAFLIFGQRK